MTPTARTLNLLRDAGFQAAIVEKWAPYASVRMDLWGFGDVLAVHPRDGLFLIVQVTTIDHVSHRLAKAKTSPDLLGWLKAGGTFEVHGWVKRGRRWDVKRVAVQAEDLSAVVLEAPWHRRPRKGRRQPELFV